MSEQTVERSMLAIGSTVEINPRSDRTRMKRVIGVISQILTNAESHPHGILVELEDGQVGRVKKLIDGQPAATDESVASEPELIIDLDALAKLPEGPFLEFKSSALWSKNLSEADIQHGTSEIKRYGRDTSKVIIAKTLSSFMNTDGGFLVIGIKENKVNQANDVVGIEGEFRKLKDPCEDGYRRMILDYIIKPFFPDFVFHNFNQYLKIDFLTVDDRRICVIQTFRSSKQVFLSINGGYDFFVRVDASSRVLTGKPLVDYCMNRFS